MIFMHVAARAKWVGMDTIKLNFHNIILDILCSTGGELEKRNQQLEIAINQRDKKTGGRKSLPIYAGNVPNLVRKLTIFHPIGSGIKCSVGTDVIIS